MWWDRFAIFESRGMSNVDCGEVHDVTFDSTIIRYYSRRAFRLLRSWPYSINFTIYGYLHRHVIDTTTDAATATALTETVEYPISISIVHILSPQLGIELYAMNAQMMENKLLEMKWNQTVFCVLAMANWFDCVHFVLLSFGNDLPINYCWRRQLNRFAGWNNEHSLVHNCQLYNMRIRCDFTDWIHSNLCQSKST